MSAVEILAVSDRLENPAALGPRCEYEDPVTTRCEDPPVYVLRWRDSVYTADMLLCAEHTAKVRATGKPMGYSTVVVKGAE